MISVNYNKVFIRKSNFRTCHCCGRNTVLSTLSSITYLHCSPLNLRNQNCVQLQVLTVESWSRSSGIRCCATGYICANVDETFCSLVLEGTEDRGRRSPKTFAPTHETTWCPFEWLQSGENYSLVSWRFF